MGIFSNFLKGGKSGDDTVVGDGGDNHLVGGAGDDTLEGGAGDDLVQGGSGDDTLIYVVSENTDSSDEYDGGSGHDTLRLELTADEWQQSDIQQDVRNYIEFLKTNSTALFQFTAFDLSVRKVELLEIVVDGQILNVVVTEPGSSTTIDASNSTQDEAIQVVGDGDADIATGSGDDTVVTENGSNTINVGDGNNSVITGSGNDTITAGDGNDTIDAGDGDNTIDVGDGNNQVTTGSGSDIITAGSGDDNIQSGAGDDTISIGDGDDIVDAGVGDDTIIAGAGGGDDVIDGSGGNDTVTYPSTSLGVTIDLNAFDRSATPASGGGTVGDLLVNAGYADPTLPVGLATGSEIGTDVLIDIENATGGAGDDTIIGNTSANTLVGAGGDDTITGGAGDDIIDGGSGTGDTAVFTQASDSGNWRVVLENGAVQFYDGIAGPVVDGNDTLKNIEFIEFGNGAVFRLQTGTAAGETISGDAAHLNIIFGGDGDDTLNAAGTFADILVGDTGNDTLNGSNTGLNDMWGLEGDDTINGGTGTLDQAQYLGSLDEFDITFDDTAVTITDTVTSANPDVLTNPSGFDEGTDTLTGVETLGFDWGANTFYGLQTGSAGADTLNGTSGNDLMFGGSGDDTITGGVGDDIIDGGAGNDTAVFTQASDTGNWRITFENGIVQFYDGINGPVVDGNDILTDIEFIEFGNGAVFSLETGTTLGETITGNSSFFNLLYGGDGDDTVSGTNAVLNALIGNAGNDTLWPEFWHRYATAILRWDQRAGC